MPSVITTEQAAEVGHACQQYVPVRDFVSKMGQASDLNPYRSTFSFVPFIEKMKRQKQMMRKVVKGVDREFLEEVERSLVAFSDPQRLDTPEKRQEVMAMLFPALFAEGQMGFVVKPFTKEFFYMTPTLQQMFNADCWEVQLTGKMTEGHMSSPAIEAGKLILNTFHGQDIKADSYQTMTFRHRKTQLERHFRFHMVQDYIKATPLKALPSLDQRQIHDLLNHWDDEAHWLDFFPPEDFTFEGLVVGYIQDVTEVETLSKMKELMLSGEDDELGNADLMRERITSLVRSYLQMAEVDFGLLLSRSFKYAKVFTWSLLGDESILTDLSREDFYANSSYGVALETEEAVVIADLQELPEPGRVEKCLLDKGYRSLLLFPEKDRHGTVIGFLEIASTEPFRFTRQTVHKLEEVISLFSVGTSRWIQNMDNNINFFIQKQFTYIHPSVEWKFQEVSQKHLFSSRKEGRMPALDPIVFKEVYPLYGQADIVGSSQMRNLSIEADMLDNLRRVKRVIKAFREKLDFQLLEVYLLKVDNFIKRLARGGFVSSDESQIVELLTEEIHPLLRELSLQYEQLPHTLLQKYCAYLDPRLDIVYRKRREYEDSVHILNDLIANYIDQEVAKKQEVLPHFFEKYITDGVEYNIYLGQSILQKGNFSYNYLKDFRLWQLQLMCEVTRLVENHHKELAVPLSTAQLVFVYNNALSIRFNMDEKQFDVDGAYNVRYEILKKRIDKAIIKGTEERLTQRGKIAIVWLQDKDRAEYMEYLQFLAQKGYITDHIEELELERLQGADGLKALRATVVP